MKLWFIVDLCHADVSVKNVKKLYLDPNRREECDHSSGTLGTSAR